MSDLKDIKKRQRILLFYEIVSFVVIAFVITLLIVINL